MKSFLAFVITLIITLQPTTYLFAHSGHEQTTDLRYWKTTNETEFEASFSFLKENKVQLLKKDGSLAIIPFEDFCHSDKTWILNQANHSLMLNHIYSNQGDVHFSNMVIKEFDYSKPSSSLIIFMVCLMVGLAMFSNFLCMTKIRFSVVLTLTLFMVGTLGLIADENKESEKLFAVQNAFQPFKAKLQLRIDDNFFYIGSNGFPDHQMMVGITAWQQQVPIPQPYIGKNSWRIPLYPKMAEKPISAKTALFRGAIALAINGVPIFNALNNRGVDSYLAGELDQFGGHCGRGDDYHYHFAPIHLESIVGKGNPIAYALDGFPIFGYTDAEGKEPKDLDQFNGRTEKDGYRYYSTKVYPYINGGMRGQVTVVGDQIDPQPKDAAIRPAGQPLRGAKITDFIRDEEKKTYILKYELNGTDKSIKYKINNDGTFGFLYQSGNTISEETYRRRGMDDEKGKQKKMKEDGPPKKEDESKKTNSIDKPQEPGEFKLSSPDFEHNGNFPVEYTGDGDGISPPLSWKGAPKGTKYFALNLWHTPGPGGMKSYWLITNIPSDVSSLPKNTKGIGIDGYNDKNRTDYDPMKSKGPGVKEYNITLYALSDLPKFNVTKVTRADLLTAIKDITLGQSTLTYKYERNAKNDNNQTNRPEDPSDPDNPGRDKYDDRPPPPWWQLSREASYGLFIGMIVVGISGVVFFRRK